MVDGEHLTLPSVAGEHHLPIHIELEPAAVCIVLDEFAHSCRAIASRYTNTAPNQLFQVEQPQPLPLFHQPETAPCLAL